MGSLTDTIVAQATATPTTEALAVMRLSALDWIACGVAGQAEPVSMIVAKMLDAELGVGQATCFDGTLRAARAAALYNGTASHALDYDDTHFAHIGHVSVGVLPAALAMAEQHNRSIDDFLAAGLAGCEGAIRMGVALGRSHYQAGFHQTATAGAFGATLASAMLMASEQRVQANALGLASTRAAGLKSQFGTMGKPYNAGLAASTGVEVAQLAQLGLDADQDGWDGVAGFIATHHGDGAKAPDGFLMPRISYKFHACCHGLHAMLEALETLKPLTPADVKSCVIYTHPRWMTVCNKVAPASGLETKFSYRAVAAMSLLGIATSALENFSDAVVQRTDVQSIMPRIEVRDDNTLSEMQARVDLISYDGKHAAFHDLDVALSLAQRQQRVRDKANSLIGTARVNKIVGLLETEGRAPVSDLTAVLRH